MGEFTALNSYLDKKRFKKRPRYSMVFHDVREELGLSLNTYVVVDSIHKLCTSDPRFPFCVMSKDDMAKFLELGRRTIFRCISEAEELELIERNEHGLRTTQKWVEAVEIYSIEH